MTTPAQRLTAAIRSPRRPGMPAIMPYVCSGFPTRDSFAELVSGLSEVSDAIEIGVPFSDPMADGPVIQRSSRVALEQGATLPWILDTLAHLPRPAQCPLVLMSYTNPLLQYGYEKLIDDAMAVGVCGFIVPDLPWEEGEAFRALVLAKGLASIQLVTPVTPEERLVRLSAGEGGFVYAVTVTGITGAAMKPVEVSAYLDRVRGLTGKPVCAGFGIRSAEHVRALTGHADGAIVGTALIEAQERGEDAVGFVRGLMG